MGVDINTLEVIMLSLLFFIGYKLLRWALVAACVLTYVEIGYGGESLGAIVNAIKSILLSIDWSTLLSEIWYHLDILLTEIFKQLGLIFGGSNG